MESKGSAPRQVLSAFVEALEPTALDSPTVRFDLVLRCSSLREYPLARVLAASEVIFNIAILIIGSTIVLGALNPEKAPLKTDHRVASSGHAVTSRV